MTADTLSRPTGASLLSVNHQLSLVVDLDERGSFRVHVENCLGRSIYEFSNEDPETGQPDADGLWLVEFGFMRHARDTDGLLDYLRTMGIVGASATLVIEE